MRRPPSASGPSHARGIRLHIPQACRPLLVVFVVFPLLVAVPFAGAQRTGTDTYAITNARVVTVTGATIDRGTIVIRDGLIVTVGPSATAPADARVIDGTGLTVYPGLIDANTSLGLAQPSPSPAATTSPTGGGGFGQLRAQTFLSALNSSQPPGLQPEVRVDDYLRAGGDQIEAARNIGFTTALSAPRTGIWMGQSALINLAGDTPQQMIVRSPVAMHVGFTPLRGGAFPNSLMGVFAALRQMLLDADRYREAQQVYERSPRGMRRPAQDRSLAALLPVLDGSMPVVMYADREREIARALDLAKEFKLRAIIAGGMEADKLASRLREENVPVLLSLNFPRRTTANLPEADPEPMRVLRERVAAPKTASQLVANGVRFAFESDSLTSTADITANILRAIENGLSRQDALRALTIWPAEIFGVADRLGSLEVGKIANLTVTRGDLFDRNARVEHVFIDGREVDLRSAPASAVAVTSVTGTWNLNVDLGSGDVAVTAILQQEGERVRGSFQGALGSGEISNGSAGSGEIRFTMPVTIEGRSTEATFTGTVSGNEITGSVTIVGRSLGAFRGSRTGPATSGPAATPTPN